MRLTKIILAGLIALGGLWTSDTYAAEKRCDELGQNCVCSEPLNTTSYAFSYPWYNPSDSTTKQCTSEAFSIPQLTGYAIIRPSADLTGSNDAAVLTRLPAGHSVQYFLRPAEGHVGNFQIRHMQIEAASRDAMAALGLPTTVQPGGAGSGRTEYVSIKRAAVRWYFYTSPNFHYALQDGPNDPCTNGKRGGMDIVTLSLSGGNAANMTYPWLRYKPYYRDCCFVGPSQPGTVQPTGAEYRDKWWRYEAVMSNRLGGVGQNMRLQVFVKNVTNNGPEISVIDTNGNNGYGPSGQWIPTPDLEPTVSEVPNFILSGAAAPFREGTGCAGWWGFSHFMMAQWDTDTGQRIGPAYEIEGGGSLPSVPSPPTTLKTW